jgi:hypothetical protein
VHDLTLVSYLAASGLLYSWGDVTGSESVTPVAFMGNRGAETDTTVVAPVTLPAGASAVKLSVSRSTVFVLLADGRFVPLGFCGLWCLSNTFDTFPNPSNPDSVIAQITGENIVDLSVYHDQSVLVNPSSHSIFCTASGSVFTAGYAQYGTLMRASPSDTAIPTLVTGFSTGSFCRKVLASRGASFVLMRDGSVWSSGKADSHGLNVYVDILVPTKMSWSSPLPFVVTDLFALTPDQPQTGFIAAGRAGAVDGIQGWGQSNELSFWIPQPFYPVAPTAINYIASDTSGKLTHCTGGVDPYPLIICTTPQNGILMWGQRITEIDFYYRFGLDQPEVNITIPSAADIRSAIPTQDINAFYDENPYPNAHLVVQYTPSKSALGGYPDGAFGFLASGQASTRSTSIGVPGIVRGVSVACMNLHTVIVTNSNETYVSTWQDSISQMTQFSLLTPFSVINFDQVIVFTRNRSDPSAPVGWIQYDEFNINIVLETIGYFGLASDGQLYWTNRAPLAEWEDGADNTTANTVAPSTLFGTLSLYPTIKKIYGKYDWFFMIDSSNELWTFGDTRFGCGCQPASDTKISTAVKVTGIANVKWIFPLVKYFNDVFQVSRFIDDSVERGTVLVAPNQIKYCGSFTMWTGLENAGLPPTCNATNPIVDASFSALSGVVKLLNGELWGIGIPESYPYGYWKRYDQEGVLRNKIVGAVAALAPGGAAVSSCTHSN